MSVEIEIELPHRDVVQDEVEEPTLRAPPRALVAANIIRTTIAEVEMAWDGEDVDVDTPVEAPDLVSLNGEGTWVRRCDGLGFAAPDVESCAGPGEEDGLSADPGATNLDADTGPDPAAPDEDLWEEDPIVYGELHLASYLEGQSAARRRAIGVAAFGLIGVSDPRRVRAA